MIFIGLDLSTNSGIAVLNENGTLVHLSDVSTENVDLTHDLAEYNMLRAARAIASRICKKIKAYAPDLIVIEQTNLGRARGSQKTLEFVHAQVLDMLEVMGWDKKVIYVDTSAWRREIGLKLSKEQRDHNKSLSSRKSKVKAKGIRFTNKKGHGKITWKHLSVEWANAKFGLDLKLVDNDKADAIALALYGQMKFKDIKNGSNAVDISVFK